MRYFIFIACIISIYSCSLSDNERKFVREGNKHYEDSTFDKAEIAYKKALDYKPDCKEAKYNLATATYKQKKYQEAAKQFTKLGDSTQNKKELGALYHNIGNSLLSAEKVDESIEAYKEALRNAPNDNETKYNLAYAMKRKKENQQNQDQKQDNKDKQNNQQEQDQDKEEDQKQEDKQEEGGDSKEEDKGENEEDQKQEDEQEGGDNSKGKEQNGEEQKEKQGTPSGISKQDAERILDAMLIDEQNTQEKAKEAEAKKVRTTKSNKDW